MGYKKLKTLPHLLKCVAMSEIAPLPPPPMNLRPPIKRRRTGIILEPSDDAKRMKNMENEREVKLAKREKELDEMNELMNERSKVLNEREEFLDDREKAMNEREAKLNARGLAMNEREAKLNTRELAMDYRDMEQKLRESLLK